MTGKITLRQKILDRGHDYYDINAVRIYTYSNEHVEAQVAGSRVYNVMINFKDRKIDSMYCDCPYFQGYDYCKHLAATLYYIEDHPELLKASEDVSDLIFESTPEELKLFLIDEIQYSPDLANKFKLFKNNGADDDFYINKLKASLTNSFEILKFIDTDIQDLIGYNEFTLMFKLFKILIDHINNELEYGEFSFLEDIIYKIDDSITQIRDTASTDEITEFLVYAVNSSEDDFILKELTDCLSRNGDIEQLIKTWEKIK